MTALRASAGDFRPVYARAGALDWPRLEVHMKKHCCVFMIIGVLRLLARCAGCGEGHSPAFRG